MKILAPCNHPNEVDLLLEAGADELYCGVLSQAWRSRFTNLASCNRREWRAANLDDVEQLGRVVARTHAHGAVIHLALNAFYTEEQYPLVLEQVEQALALEVDALIVADPGLIRTLHERYPAVRLHISTGGTTFNRATVAFYRSFGAARIVLPRQLRIEEMTAIIAAHPDLEFEAFVLNSGCKNIDGFCTFQHGVSELRHGPLWKVPKRLGLDGLLLDGLRYVPKSLARKVRAGRLPMDSACHLSYQVTDLTQPSTKQSRRLAKNVKDSFSLLAAVDPCAACRLPELLAGGLHGVKIVGRNHPTAKKHRDVVFLRGLLDALSTDMVTDFRAMARQEFRRLYGYACAELCYYSDEAK